LRNTRRLFAITIFGSPPDFSQQREQIHVYTCALTLFQAPMGLCESKSAFHGVMLGRNALFTRLKTNTFFSLAFLDTAKFLSYNQSTRAFRVSGPSRFSSKHLSWTRNDDPCSPVPGLAPCPRQLAIDDLLRFAAHR
jgi:hypothetical protein